MEYAQKDAPSGERVELIGCDYVHIQSSPMLTWLGQQINRATEHSVCILGSTAQRRRARKHTHTRMPHLEPTHSGQVAHQASHVPAHTTTGLPTPSGTVYTKDIFFFFKFGRDSYFI